MQFEPRLADVDANLETAERLGRAAGEAGAKVIILPEFFSTGMGFEPQLRNCLLEADGPATELLLGLAREYEAVVGGSFLCAGDPPRNAFILAGPAGILGRHDKDIPTMWENCFYAGGDDPGRISSGTRIGLAVCWELMRLPTAARLRGQTDLLVGGSAWWSMPEGWWTSPLRGPRLRNAENATAVAPAMARLVGAPVVHAALCGPIECRLLGSPMRYRGRYEGGALICDAQGAVLASRRASEGEGYVMAEIDVGAARPAEPLPRRYWLHRRGAVTSAVWTYQGWRGRRWRDRSSRSPAQHR